LATELHEAIVKLHETKEEVYTFKTFMQKPSKPLEAPPAEMELQTRFARKMDEMKPSVDVLCDPNATPEKKETALANAQQIIEEMSGIVFQPMTEAVVFQPNPGKSNYLYGLRSM
jgi:hypothetical protein